MSDRQGQERPGEPQGQPGTRVVNGRPDLKQAGRQGPRPKAVLWLIHTHVACTHPPSHTHIHTHSHPHRHRCRHKQELLEFNVRRSFTVNAQLPSVVPCGTVWGCGVTHVVQCGGLYRVERCSGGHCSVWRGSVVSCRPLSKHQASHFTYVNPGSYQALNTFTFCPGKMQIPKASFHSQTSSKSFLSNLSGNLSYGATCGHGLQVWALG